MIQNGPYVESRIDAVYVPVILPLITANLTKVRGAKPRVLASSEKPWMTPRRTPRSPGCR